MKRCTCGKPNCRLEFKYDTDAAFRVQWDAMPEPPLPSKHGGECGGCKEKKSPSIVQKVKNFSQSYEAWVRAGKPLTPDDAYADRRQKCDGCDARDKESDTCTECGCPLEKPGLMVRVLTDSPGKLHQATQECPRGYWKAALPVMEKQNEHIGS